MLKYIYTYITIYMNAGNILHTNIGGQEQAAQCILE